MWQALKWEKGLFDLFVLTLSDHRTTMAIFKVPLRVFSFLCYQSFLCDQYDGQVGIVVEGIAGGSDTSVENIGETERPGDQWRRRPGAPCLPCLPSTMGPLGARGEPLFLPVLCCVQHWWWWTTLCHLQAFALELWYIYLTNMGDQKRQ